MKAISYEGDICCRKKVKIIPDSRAVGIELIVALQNLKMIR